MNNLQQMKYIIKYLLNKKVPMIRKNETEEWFSVRLTKKDQFYRANGKIISKVMAVTIAKHNFDINNWIERVK